MFAEIENLPEQCIIQKIKIEFKLEMRPKFAGYPICTGTGVHLSPICPFKQKLKIYANGRPGLATCV